MFPQQQQPQDFQQTHPPTQTNDYSHHEEAGLLVVICPRCNRPTPVEIRTDAPLTSRLAFQCIHGCGSFDVIVGAGRWLALFLVRCRSFWLWHLDSWLGVSGVAALIYSAWVLYEKLGAVPLAVLVVVLGLLSQDRREAVAAIGDFATLFLGVAFGSYVVFSLQLHRPDWPMISGVLLVMLAVAVNNASPPVVYLPPPQFDNKQKGGLGLKIKIPKRPRGDDIKVAVNDTAQNKGGSNVRIKPTAASARRVASGNHRGSLL
jgi:hypothetical protein